MQLCLFNTDLHVSKITIKTALTVLQAHHYLGGVSVSAQCYGAYKNNVLLGVICFGTPVSENVRSMMFGVEYKQHVIELSRLCLIPECEIPASKIVSAAIRALEADRKSAGQSQIHCIISFADTHQGHHGGVYQAMSWMYVGSTKNTRNIYTDNTGRIRSSRQNGKEVTAVDAGKLGWSLVRRSTTKHRYIKFLGSKGQKRHFKRILQLQILPYPKQN